MDLRAFQMLDFINNRLSNIEKNIEKISEKLDFSIAIQRNHLIRIKHGEPLDDSMILMGKPYNDFTPQAAHEIFQNKDMDYILLDVTHKEYTPIKRLEGAIHIPLEELNQRYTELQNRTIPILIISEVGLRSIKACELLVRKGYFNVNNVSGGYKFWPGFKDQNLQQVIAD